MPLLAVQRPGAQLAMESKGLVVRFEGITLRKVKLQHIDDVHVYGRVDVTASARNLLLGRGVALTFFDGRGRYLGRLVPPGSHQARRRMEQYRKLGYRGFALEVARPIVEGKLRNQRTVLQKVNRDRAHDELLGPIGALRKCFQKARQAEDIESLRGVEGYGARMFFRGYGAAVEHDAFAFTGRNRRPPRDPINACLSFGYTILLTRVETAVRKVGLDPYLGAFHDPGRAKPAMALDLMEEFRPFVSRLVLRLINRQQLSPEDFEDPNVEIAEIAAIPREEDDDEVRAVYLARTGRAIFLRALQDLWRTRLTYPPRDARFELGDIIDMQAEVMVRHIEADEPYEPFLMR